jgi:hypothetical protein
MIRLLFVGDGDRDSATVPRIVETIVGTRIDPVTRNWARLHGGGLRRKIRFGVLDAQACGALGTVMTLDRDRSPAGRRMRTLAECQAELRGEFPPFPIAFGCANPHGEAWLLADQAAVRNVLRLEAATAVPSAKVGSPKASLESLLRTSARAGERPLEIWAEIAKALDPKRCAYQKDTGFRAFVKEIEEEIGPLTEKSSSPSGGSP